MNTRQTMTPVRRLHLESTYRSAREMVRMIADGLMTYDLPYQRGSVWTPDQRIALIRSWLDGTPIPSVIINDRWNAGWRLASGDIGTAPGYAVIDGRQRLQTAELWFAGQLAVPASWFEASEVLAVEDTDDGHYVRYTGLTRAEQTSFAVTEALLPFAAAKVATVQAEAEIYLRVNGGGTAQSAGDMDRAARIADGLMSKVEARRLPAP
jgi:hypothetical protein